MSSTNKVSLTLDDIIKLKQLAINNGTELAYIEILIEWAKAANAEVARLQNELQNKNG